MRTPRRGSGTAEADPSAALTAWLGEGLLHKLVLVVASVASKEPLERWVFNVQREEEAAEGYAWCRQAVAG